MLSWTEFASLVTSHSMANGYLWPTYGTFGVLLASLTTLAAELWQSRKRKIDLKLRSAGTSTVFWERNRVRRELNELSPNDVRFDIVSERAEGETWRMESRMRHCFELNGDFGETVELDHEYLAFFLGDVSGKGLPAALYQASCTALLRYATTTPGRAVEAVAEVNSVLCQRDPDGRYATLLYGVLNTNTGLVTLVSAGHPHPLLLKEDGTVESVAMPRCLPLGLDAKTAYKAVELGLQKGDTLLLFSDGVVEARNRNRETFTEERVYHSSLHHLGRDLEDVVDGVMQAVENFSYRITDDRTVLALAYRRVVPEHAEEEDESYSGCRG